MDEANQCPSSQCQTTFPVQTSKQHKSTSKIANETSDATNSTSLFTEKKLSVRSMGVLLPEIQRQFNIKVENDMPATLRTPCIKEDTDDGTYTSWGGGDMVTDSTNQQIQDTMKSPIEYLRATIFTSSDGSQSHAIQIDWGRLQIITESSNNSDDDSLADSIEVARKRWCNESN